MKIIKTLNFYFLVRKILYIWYKCVCMCVDIYLHIYISYIYTRIHILYIYPISYMCIHVYILYN